MDNPIVAALRAAAAKEAEEERVFREAAEKLPVKDAMRRVLLRLESELNAELQEAVERFLGGPLAEPEQLRGRLMHAQLEGDEGLTYFVDRVPILWVAPSKIERDGNLLRVERPIRQLLPESTP